MKIYIAVEFEAEIPDGFDESSPDDELEIDEHIKENFLASMPEHLVHIDYMWDFEPGVISEE